MTEILVLDGHPNPESFVAALAHAYADGARASGASVRTIALRDLGFDPVLHLGFRGEQPLEPDLQAALEAIRGARHVVFAFPIWWAAAPALVKGFVDRVFLPDVAFRFEPGKALATGLFAGRSARLVTTMDSPWVWYWWKHGRSAHNAFIQGTLEFVGFSKIETRTVYGVRTLDVGARAKAITQAAKDGAYDAQRLVRQRPRLAATSAA